MAATLAVMCCGQLWAQAQAQPQVIDQVAAVVGNKIIMKSDVENQYAQYLAAGQPAKRLR